MSLIDELKKAGVKHVFGIPSIHNIGLYDALRDDPSISHVLCRTEAGATHIADGYARSGKGLGVVISSTGPGACYMAAPLLEALGSSSPVMAITSNIETTRLGRGTGALHELKDQDLIFKEITKGRFCIRSAGETRMMVRKAAQRALSERPGPVYMEVPTDLWNIEVSDRDNPEALAPFEGGAEPCMADLDRASHLLLKAERPVVITGAGAKRAGIGREILSICETIRAPLVTSAEGKGLIPEDHEMAFGNAARRGITRDILSSSDIALAIGTRLRHCDFHRRGVTLPALIHVDWDKAWINKNYPAEISIIGDVTTIAGELLARLRSVAEGTGKSSWNFRSMRERLGKEREDIARQCRELVYIDAIRRAVPQSGALVIDNTILGYWSEYFFPSLAPGNLVTGKGSSIIGFAFPAAIGLKIACPDTPIVALTGDGGFFYGAQELATCRRNGIGFPVVVVNDNCFGMIELLQHQAYRRGAFETKLFNPDLRKFAESFGLRSERVDSPESLEKALCAAIESREMCIIELAQSFRESPFARF